MRNDERPHLAEGLERAPIHRARKPSTVGKECVRAGLVPPSTLEWASAVLELDGP